MKHRIAVQLRRLANRIDPPLLMTAMNITGLDRPEFTRRRR